MANPRTGNSHFEMQDLPVEVAKKVELMQPGDISEAFVMKDASSNRDVVAVVKLSERIPGHKANLAEDYNMIKGMFEQRKRQEILKDWIEKKIKDTYVKIADGWNTCDFQYEGWIKD